MTWRRRLELLVVNPSLWYDKGVLFRLEERETRDAAGQGLVKDLAAFAGGLKRREYPSLRLKLWIAPDETHHSVFPGAAMRGLQWVLGNDKIP